MAGSSTFKRSLRSRARGAAWPSLIFHLLLPARAEYSRIEPIDGGVLREEFASGRNLLSKESRIIGGTPAEEDYPYAVSMFLNEKFGCAGSLINKDTVLTAAHCLSMGDKAKTKKALTVRVGSNLKDKGRKMSVREVVVHPRYDDVTDEYDLGLLFLRKPTTLDVPLPKLNADNSFPAPGTTAHAMGWGDTDVSPERKTPSNELMDVDLKVISNEACREAEGGDVMYRNWIFDDMMCTYTEGHDACQGDSGGPLIIRGENPESDVIVGVVSWGVGCSIMPGVFSRISASYDWIRETACELSREPPGSLCADDAADSRGPTWSPSETPTLGPSPIPTWSPSDMPTFGPSMSPAESPTDRPTLKPSKIPTHAPTISPTTDEPTSSPTRSPTSTPSLSVEPSRRPSARPSTLSRSSSTRPSSTSVRPSPRLSPESSPNPSGPPAATTSFSQFFGRIKKKKKKREKKKQRREKRGGGEKERG